MRDIKISFKQFLIQFQEQDVNKAVQPQNSYKAILIVDNINNRKIKDRCTIPSSYFGLLGAVLAGIYRWLEYNQEDTDTHSNYHLLLVKEGDSYYVSKK